MRIYIAGPFPRGERGDLARVYAALSEAVRRATADPIVEITVPEFEKRLAYARDDEFNRLLTSRMLEADGVIAYLAAGYAGPPAESMFALTVGVPTLIFAEPDMRLSRFITGANRCSVGDIGDLVGATYSFVRSLGKPERDR